MAIFDGRAEVEYAWKWLNVEIDAESGEQPNYPHVVGLSYDSRTDSLETLIAVSKALRGPCDYRSEEEDQHLVVLLTEAMV